MPDGMTRREEDCSFWDCGDIESPFVCDHVRAEGEKGVCKPRRCTCVLEIGQSCGMYLEKPEFERRKLYGNHDD